MPNHHRLKGGALLLGATGPGERGPFGVWPTDDVLGDDQEHEGMLALPIPCPADQIPDAMDTEAFTAPLPSGILQADPH
ncbi:hypothetical protein [Streptomyces marianii]|uniref:hypothetical protein n=1 Tax=Streptomyces marianii TaxID=1817406 RepID=UPI001486FDC3|nr:hypothetical protein [Streptomyces marianii]